MTILDEWLSLRGLSESELRQRFAMQNEHMDRDANYNHLRGVTEYYNPAKFPGRFYFRDSQLVLIYMLESAALEQLGFDGLQAQLGKAEAELRSRYGREFTHYVYLTAGVAFSSDGQEVYLLEIFPPTTLKEYLEVLYEDPGEFYK